MILTLTIQGMSCGHCVAAVRNALAEVPGVTIRDVGIGTATVETDAAGSIDAMKRAIDEAGYTASIAGQ